MLVQPNEEGRRSKRSCGLPADGQSEGREVNAREGSLGVDEFVNDCAVL